MVACSYEPLSLICCTYVKYYSYGGAIMKNLSGNIRAILFGKSDTQKLSKNYLTNVGGGG